MSCTPSLFRTAPTAGSSVRRNRLAGGNFRNQGILIPPAPGFRALCFLILVFRLCFAVPALAEDINYPGYDLKPSPVSGTPASLFPALFDADFSPSGNTVTVNGGVIPGDVYGGLARTPGAVSGNRVRINQGATVGGTVFGGYSNLNGDVASNSVTISGGTIHQAVAGGYSDGPGSVAGNSVTVGNGLVIGNIYGGFAVLNSALGNSVTINSGTLSGSVYGGLGGTGSALNNTVIINGGEVAGTIYGGFSASGEASSNRVVITGGTLSGTVYGGYSNSADAVRNTIILAGSPNLSASAIYGGFSNNAAKDAFSGNALAVLGFQGTVAALRNFQSYTLVLPSSMQAGQTLLTVTGTADLTGGGAGSSVVNLSVMAGGRPLAVGDTVTLIRAGTLTGSPLNTTTQGLKGLALLYDFDLAAAGDTLTATVTGSHLNPRTRALAEGRAAGQAFLNQGSDLIIGPGLRNALASAGAERPEEARLAPFAALSGGWSRYDTGSHVDVEGFSLLTGLARSTPLPAGSLLLGAFFEAGWGNYDSYNGFTNYASVKGDGNTSYYGGGLLGRYSLPGGAYLDASLRAGRVNTDFGSSDLRTGTGNTVDYDYSAAYYGAHAGLGYFWSMGSSAGLDISTKYLRTRQDSDNTEVVGDTVHFATVDSRRWRSDARFTYALSQYVAPYIGAGYEYEFDGKSKAESQGYTLGTADLRGGTGIGELGLTVTPAAGTGLSFNLGVQGYTGVREGVTGSLQMKWEF